MRWFVTATAMMAVVVAPAAFAEDAPEELSITASVDKTELTVGDQVTLTITLRGPIAQAKMETFDLPEHVTVVAEQSAQNMTIQLGHVNYAVTRTYVLQPEQAGRYTLGPFQVEHNKHTYETQPILLDVKPGSTAPSRPGRPPAGKRLVI